MGFGLTMKNCAKCGSEFSTHEDRVDYCKDCYQDESEPFEYFEGDFYEKQT